MLPQFIIEHRGIFYATNEVFEYDPNFEPMTREIREGVGAIQRMHRQGVEERRIATGVTVVLEIGVDLSAFQSSSPVPGPRPRFFDWLFRWFR